MELKDAIGLLDTQLENEPKVHEMQKAHSEHEGVWLHETYRADVTAAGSTGIELRLSTRGQMIHERIFASSPASVPRIARAIIEHLTGYANNPK